MKCLLCLMPLLLWFRAVIPNPGPYRASQKEYIYYTQLFLFYLPQVSEWPFILKNARFFPPHLSLSSENPKLEK